MVQRSLVTLLAALGGILVILGGILGFFLSFAPYGVGVCGYGQHYCGSAYVVVIAALAVLFGLVILVYSGFTHLRGAERSLTGGVVLVILGIIPWVIAGGWLLVALGSFLTVLAGLILLAEILLGNPHIVTTQSPP
jgi:amino acid transporter